MNAEIVQRLEQSFSSGAEADHTQWAQWAELAVQQTAILELKVQDLAEALDKAGDDYNRGRLSAELEHARRRLASSERTIAMTARRAADSAPE